MSATTAPSTAAPARSKRRPFRFRRRGIFLRAYTWLIILWLMTPIFVIALFGFNDTKGKFNYTWQGFTLNWYRHLFDINELTSALVNSLTIAAIVTAISAVLGTGLGFAVGRWRFRGAGTTELVLFANISAPEITLATALLSLFVTANIPRGYWTIVIAQVMFDVAYVAVTVRARMSGYDVHLEEASRDLGAGALTTFRLVTLPLLLPGIIAGSLLAFALSIDDFVITQFNAGQTLTFPLWVYGATRVGVPPQVNVMGTLIFVGGVLLAVASVLINRRRR
jgi:spermidine/putrescine transport system permease protein